MHKTIFTWFGNLPTSTELHGFHYKIRRYNSAQEHSQETQFPIHPNSLSPTRQENTVLSSYVAARLLGIFFFYSHGLPYITNLIYIYIYIYIYRSAVLGIIILVEFGLLLTYIGLWQFKPHGPNSTGICVTKHAQDPNYPVGVAKSSTGLLLNHLFIDTKVYFMI